MMNKIQRKFMFIAMTVTFLVMVGVLGIVNAVFMFNTYTDLKARLIMISDNSGNVPTGWDNNENKNVSKDQFNKLITPETRFITRYFTALIDKDNNIVDVNMTHVASVDEDKAKEYIKNVIDSSARAGIRSSDTSTYVYLITDRDNNQKLVVFLDATQKFDTCRMFLNLSASVALCALVAIFLIVYLWSKKAIAPIIENNQRQKQFITNAGHELKTPLAIISANTEVLEMTEGKNEWTESTLTQVKRLTGLVNSLITLAKMDEGNGDLKLGNTDISKLVNECASSFKSMITTQGKNFVTDIEENINYNTNKDMFAELVNIFMDNAVKYCDDGGTIKASLHRKGKNVIFSVSNNYAEGAGEDCSRFFERFYRNDTSHNSKKQGYGIGLSMAEGMARSLKGKIWADWKDGFISFNVQI